MKSEQIFEGIRYYPAANPDHGYFYFATTPAPQTDSNGDPMISITGAGEHWFLQASTRWAAPSATVDELGKALINQGLIHNKIDLKPAPLEVGKAELILILNEAEHVLATSRSSGHYPFTAIFNTSISEELQDEVVAAFHGKKEALVVKYHAVLRREYPLVLSLSGPIHQVVKDLDRVSSDADIADWLETQIQKGVMDLSHESSEEVSGDAVNKAQEKIKEEAISEIRRFLGPAEMTPDESALEIVMDEPITVAEAIIASTDISVWFKNNPDDHIKIIA